MPDTKEKRDKLEIGQISDEILEKYNRPGPRYTSYPTAPVWRTILVPTTSKILPRRKQRTPLSLYMHLPFCESLCLFCACNVSSQRIKRRAPYLAALKKEIEHVAGRVSATAPWASSTGAAALLRIFPPSKWKTFFTYTRERFTFAPDAEIGIEVDPRVTNRAHLETLRRLGFNRLSMGIQDFQPEVQETIHRVQPYEMTRDLIAIGRDLGSRASTWT